MQKKKMIPIVDMENFTTIYNEKSKVFKTFNAWEYYFEQFSKVNLKNIYKKNFLFQRRKT